MRRPSKDPHDYQTSGRSQPSRSTGIKPSSQTGTSDAHRVTRERTSRELVVARVKCRAPEPFHVQLCLDGDATTGPRWAFTVSQN
jgi:hypothetical protein